MPVRGYCLTDFITAHKILSQGRIILIFRVVQGGPFHGVGERKEEKTVICQIFAYMSLNRALAMQLQALNMRN